MKYFFPSSSDFQVLPSFSGRQTRLTPCLIYGTEVLWEIHCWDIWKREEVRGREHEHFIPWMRLESLYRPLYTTIPASVDRHRWFCLEWRMWEGRINYSACQCIWPVSDWKTRSGAAIEVALVEIPVVRYSIYPFSHASQYLPKK